MTISARVMFCVALGFAVIWQLRAAHAQPHAQTLSMPRSGRNGIKPVRREVAPVLVATNVQGVASERWEVEPVSLDNSQCDALLDVFEQCRAVSVAYGQAEAHQLHKANHECDSACDKIGTAVANNLASAIAELHDYFKVAMDEYDVPEATLDHTLYCYLPDAVFDYIYTEAADSEET